MATNDYIHIGTRNYWGEHPIGLFSDDLFQHLEINGQTGTGKSTILKSITSQLISHGHGLTLIDLNGDLSLDQLEEISLSRRNDVVFVDPTDTEHVLPINSFYGIPVDQRARVADEFVQACKSIWDDSWGERMEWFLYNIVAAILHAPHELRPTMLSINLMLSIQNYRRAVLKHVNDPEILRFFKDEFDKATPRELREILRPIQNKIGKIVASPFVHHMVSPYKPAFQFKDAIAKRKIVIIRLPKGTLGETAANY